MKQRPKRGRPNITSLPYSRSASFKREFYGRKTPATAGVGALISAASISATPVSAKPSHFASISSGRRKTCSMVHYERSQSLFEQSDFPGERKTLCRKNLPSWSLSVTSCPRPYSARPLLQTPSDGSGRDRKNLRRAIGTFRPRQVSSATASRLGG